MRGACEKGRESFHLPVYFGQWTLITPLSWACKEANFGSLRDSGSMFFTAWPGDAAVWNSSVEL